MQYRTLGRTGLRVSEIGYGAWGVGGVQWLGGNDTEAKKALNLAFDLGVNFFDTALAYGNGHSENLIRDLTKQVGRSNIIIATKIPPMNRQWPAQCGVRLEEVFPPSYLRKSVQASLRNLGSDFIDVLQLHVWQDHWLEKNDWQQELIRLKEEGKIRYIGVSINDHDPESAILLAQSKIADTIQVIYNIFDPTPEDALFSLCKDASIGIIARCPFDEGALSGSVTATTHFEEGDFRALYFKDKRPIEVEAKVVALKTLLGEEAKTLFELALRFCLSNPVVSTVIPGMRKTVHVEANAAVSDGRKLSSAVLAQLKQHAWPKNFYP